MTDRELLELAAKAVGVRFIREDDEYYKTHAFFGLWLVFDDEPGEYARRYWNPLTDDGDALRLAVKLRFDVDTYYGEVASGEEGDRQQTLISNTDDPYAATRRAIVRAAAATGANQ